MRGKVKAPSFLIKSLLVLIAAGGVLGYIVLNVPPFHSLIVLLFLFLLLFFLSNFASLLFFAVRFSGQQRVWYLKEKEFSSIYTASLFASLFVVLFLFLRYINYLNIYSIGLLIVLIGVSYFFSLKS